MHHPRSGPALRPDLVLALLALSVIIALLWLGPHALDLADRAGYAVCHRIPAHSFSIGGRQLPLCARCSGLYLGALAGLGVLALRGRGQVGHFPARPYRLLLGLFMLLWAADGTNSFLALLQFPHLYPPSNPLRLITGALAGVSIAAILLPALNMTLWRDPLPARSIANAHDLLELLLGAAIVVALVAVGWDWLLYPLGLLSGVAVPMLLAALNAMFFLAVRRREGVATHWRHVALPLLVGLALALSQIALIGLARDALTRAYGLPF